MDVTKRERGADLSAGTANTFRTTYRDDALERGTQILHECVTTGTSTLRQLDYTWGNGSTGRLYQRSSYDTSGGSQAVYHDYAYDKLARLVEDKRQVGAGAVVDRDFDYTQGTDVDVQFWEELKTDGSSDEVFSQATDGSHQISQYDPTPGSSGDEKSATFDVAGNMTQFGSRNLYYDHENRLVHIDDTTDFWFRYDALGRRIGEKEGTTVRFFFYDGPHIVEETDSSLLINRLSIFGIKLDEVIYSGNTTNQGNGSLDSNAVRWPLENHLGSIIAVYDNSGALKSDYDYTAFGAATNAGAEAYPYQFTGRRSIETAKLLDYRTRAYDPDCGRFLQRDSIGVWGDVANFGNGYAYVGNDPVNSLDALGLEGEFDQEFDPTVEFHIDFDPTLRAQDMFNLPRPSLSGIRLADIQYVPTVETVHDPDPERPPPPPPEHPSNTSFGLFTVQLPFGLFLRFGGFLAGVQRGGAFQVVGAEGYVDIGAQW